MLLDGLRSLFRTSEQACSYALLWEDDVVSWMRYSSKGEILGQGVGNWQEALTQSRNKVNKVRVMAAGNKTFYGMSAGGSDSVESEIPFASGKYQIRTVQVPELEGGKTAEFYAVACDSLIEEISKSLSALGHRLSSLEVPATVLARRSESLKEAADCLLQIHVGYKYTQFLVSYRGFPYVAREIRFGLKDLVEQCATHLRISQEKASCELQALSVVGAGPVEPAVVKLLEQAGRTLRLFPKQLEAVSVIGPGWLRGLETRFADRFEVTPIFSEEQSRTNAPLLSEVAES
jgi:hypothetical protein